MCVRQLAIGICADRYAALVRSYGGPQCELPASTIAIRWCPAVQVIWGAVGLIGFACLSPSRDVAGKNGRRSGA